MHPGDLGDGGGNDDDGGEQDGACLMSTKAEPSSEATQLAAVSGFFSEYLKAAKKRMTGKRSKSSFMAGHYILSSNPVLQAANTMHTVLIVDDSDINLT
jgi:hypothetical protein